MNQFELKCILITYLNFKGQVQRWLQMIEDQINQSLKVYNQVFEKAKFFNINENHNIFDDQEQFLKIKNNQLELNFSQSIEQHDNLLKQELKNVVQRLNNIHLNLQKQHFKLIKSQSHENILIVNEFLAKKQLLTGIEKKSAFSVLTPQINGKIKIGFKIHKLIFGIAVGICELETIKKNQFRQGEAAKLGHGYYFMCNDGRTYNSSIKAQNDFNSNFKYNSGDTIVMKYNPKTKIAKFKKNNDNCQMFLDIVDNGKTLHPGFSLLHTDEEVEIINF